MRRGHRMTVPASSAQSWQAAFTGCYDDAEIGLLVPHIAPASLVLDIGASLGFYTIAFALAAREVGARVLAIEPVERNCEIIRRNVELNGLGDVVSVLQTALGRVSTQVTLHVESGGAGNATIVTGLDPAEVKRHDAAGNTGAVETVQLRRLDDLDLSDGDRERPCSLMKLDTEGSEIDILAGGESFINAHRPVIVAEFNLEWLATRGVAASGPVDWAQANGYLCHQLMYQRTNPAFEVGTASLEPMMTALAPRSGSDLVLLPNLRRRVDPSPEGLCSALQRAELT